MDQRFRAGQPRAPVDPVHPVLLPRGSSKGGGLLRKFFKIILKGWAVVPVLFFVSSANLSAEPEYPKVLAVSGEADPIRPEGLPFVTISKDSIMI